MKKILVFSDLHANKQALIDIIPLIAEVDLSIFCGDMLGFGKDIDYCIDFILNNVDLIVLGNHDRLAITNENLEGEDSVVRESILFTRSKLTMEQIKILSSLPKEIYYKNIYVTHSIGDNYLERKNDFKRLCKIAPKDIKYIFFGHTHEKVIYKFNNKIIINPGSITKGRRRFDRGYLILDGENIQFVNLEDIL